MGVIDYGSFHCRAKQSWPSPDGPEAERRRRHRFDLTRFFAYLLANLATAFARPCS
jgi:hypothetical protein